MTRTHVLVLACTSAVMGKLNAMAGATWLSVYWHIGALLLFAVFAVEGWVRRK